MPSGTNRNATATAVGGLFFPQSQSLGIDRAGQSPAVLAKVIYAGTALGSFASASEALSELAEIDVPAKQVERRTQQIGAERCAERDAATDAYLALPLVERKAVPEGVTAPDLAVVEMDGGRLQIFDRSLASDGAVSAKKKKGAYWREDKVGLLASMASPRHAEIKANAKANGVGGASSDSGLSPCECAAATSDNGLSQSEYEPPELVVRSVVATKQPAERFGELLACAAWQRGFYGSSRKAFLGDGSNANWGVWERHFSSFTPTSISSTR
jgi:hypothetical protein